MKFLTLVEIEIKKILPWLITLFIGLITVSGGLFYYSINNYKAQILPEIMNSSVSEYVEQYGQLSLVQKSLIRHPIYLSFICSLPYS